MMKVLGLLTIFFSNTSLDYETRRHRKTNSG